MPGAEGAVGCGCPCAPRVSCHPRAPFAWTGPVSLWDVDGALAEAGALVALEAAQGASISHTLSNFVTRSKLVGAGIVPTGCF